MHEIHRPHTALKECIAAFPNAKNEKDFIEKICHVLVHSAGYHSAWIGVTKQNDRSLLDDIAQAGFPKEFSEQVCASWPDKTNITTIAIKAIETGKPQIARNIQEGPDLGTLRREAKEKGHSSIISLPLILKGQVLGILNVYAVGAEAFDENEALLLTGLADNLAGNLYNLSFSKVIAGADKEHQMVSMFFENAVEAIMVTGKDNIIQLINPAFTGITGYTPEEAIGKNVDIIKSNEHDDEFFNNMTDLLEEKGQWQGEVWIRVKDGEAFPVLLTITAIKDMDGNIEQYSSVFYNVSAFKQKDDAIQYEAQHDALTGLPNRSLFMDRLKAAIARGHREKSRLAVLFLDLDNFKNVNDSLGHDAGDLLLKEAAARLIECLREVDTISRLGGDEFTVLLENLSNEQDITRISRKLIKSLSHGYTLKGEEVFITVSVGITLFPDDGDSVVELIKNADLAMYHAKKLGKNNYQIFNNGMKERTLKRLKMEKDLRKALDRNELLTYYQPKVNIKSGKIVGMEALIRWRKADGILISPVEFIPLAEETGLIIGIDEWMLQSACAFIRDLQGPHLNDLSVSVNVSVNLSAIVLERKDLVETVTNKVNELGLEHHHVELEVTESSIIRNVDLAIDTIQRLRDGGFNVAMDDFGTGYSSLSYLTKLPINILKMDRAFVIDLPTNIKARSVAKAIVTMAHDMDIKIIAEGVETREQLDILKSIDCDEIQGFIFSRPLPQEDLRKLLLENRTFT